MYTIGLRSTLSVAISLLAVAALSASTAAAAQEPEQTYRVENVRTAEDRAAVERTGATVVDSDHGALIVSASTADARRLERLPFRLLSGAEPRLPERADGLQADSRARRAQNVTVQPSRCASAAV